METPVDKYINNVMGRLTIKNPEDEARVWIEACILHYEGFTVNEAVFYCSSMPEVNPGLLYGSNIRNQIRQQVQARKKAG